MIANGYGVSFRGDENVLKLDSSDDCTTLCPKPDFFFPLFLPFYRFIELAKDEDRYILTKYYYLQTQLKNSTKLTKIQNLKTGY